MLFTCHDGFEHVMQGHACHAGSCFWIPAVHVFSHVIVVYPFLHVMAVHVVTCCHVMVVHVLACIVYLFMYGCFVHALVVHVGSCHGVLNACHGVSFLHS